MWSELKRQNINANEASKLLNEALEAAADPHIDELAEKLRDELRTLTRKKQQVGIATTREIIAALGIWLNENDANE